MNLWQKAGHIQLPIIPYSNCCSNGQNAIETKRQQLSQINSYENFMVWVKLELDFEE